MRKEYEAPKLFVDEFVPDTMIASSGAKNGHGEDGECWGCDIVPGKQEDGSYCFGGDYPGC